MSELFITQDGSHSLHSAQFGVSYHSKYGAITETQHVFINAGLLHKAKEQSALSVLEIGFGTGLNAYMTLLEAVNSNLQIDYVTYEAFPISQTQVKALNYTSQLQSDFHTSFEEMHLAPSGEKTELLPSFHFQKFIASFDEINYQDQFDVIYFDAFAPTSQPELWEAPLLQKMYDALKSGGVLTTYCAKGVVKRTLKAIGFTIEAIPGPPGKREMTRGIKR